MNIRHLQIFVAVCDEMNMTVAAKKLYMSQSAVSQSISELESYYGVKLFERLSKKIYITEAGEKLLGYGRHIIGMNLIAEKEMKGFSEHPKIRIGASVTISAWRLPELICEFKKECGVFFLEAFGGNTSVIEELILKDKLDVALVEGDVINKDIETIEFEKDELILICGAAHPFRNKKNIDPSELKNEEFILREEGSGTRKTFEREMSKNQLSWRTIFTCSDAETIKNSVEKGIGISVISRLTVEKEMREGRLYEVFINDMRFLRTFKIIFHKNKFQTDLMKRFIEFVLKN